MREKLGGKVIFCRLYLPRLLLTTEPLLMASLRNFPTPLLDIYILM